MVQDDGRVGLDRVGVVFDDRRAVSDGGVVLVATVAGRLGIGVLADRLVRLGGVAGAANAGRKVLTLIYAMVLGAVCIDAARCCGPEACRAWWGGSRRRPRLGRSCARSRSGMSANWTSYSLRH
jgi:hypothetical protein